MKITVGLAQISPKLADVRSNCETHMMFVDRAAREKVDLLVFPELSLTGYMLQDAMALAAHKAVPSDPLMNSMLEASQRLDLVVGFAEVDERGRYFTSGAYLSRGQIMHVHRKVYLPTYGMFDEGRFFDAGDSIRAFDTRFGRMARVDLRRLLASESAVSGVAGWRRCAAAHFGQPGTRIER